MRHSGAWMTIWDDRILEYIDDNGPTSVKKLHEADPVKVSKPHVSRRCRKLVEHGLMVDLGNGVYDITDRGQGYLAGEINTHEDAPDKVPESNNDRPDPTESDV